MFTLGLVQARDGACEWKDNKNSVDVKHFPSEVFSFLFLSAQSVNSRGNPKAENTEHDSTDEKGISFKPFFRQFNNGR